MFTTMPKEFAKNAALRRQEHRSKVCAAVGDMHTIVAEANAKAREWIKSGRKSKEINNTSAC